ncbi:MAG: response regulator transcription factor, partial [Candidatus Dormibacteraceae bacterium]
LGAVHALVGEAPSALGPADEDAYARSVATVKARLGAATFAAAHAQGRAMPLDEAVSRGMAIYVPPDAPNLASAGRARAPANPLSRREREVAALVARGMTNRAIAEMLVITEGTANLHVKHILTKLDLRTRTQLAIWAVQTGLSAEGIGQLPR